MSIRILQPSEVDQLLTLQLETTEYLSDFKVASVSAYRLSLAKLRYLLVNGVLTKKSESWALAGAIFTGLVAYRQKQEKMKDTGLPPAWSGVALCMLMELRMLRTSDFREVSGLGESVVSGLRSGSRKMSAQNMRILASTIGVPASWFVENSVTKVGEKLNGAVPMSIYKKKIVKNLNTNLGKNKTSPRNNLWNNKASASRVLH